MRDLIAAEQISLNCLVYTDKRPIWIPLAEHPIFPLVNLKKAAIQLKPNLAATPEPASSIRAEEILEASLSDKQRRIRAQADQLKSNRRDALAPLILAVLGGFSHDVSSDRWNANL